MSRLPVKSDAEHEAALNELNCVHLGPNGCEVYHERPLICRLFGTTPHFASEALGIAAGANFMHVPFKGAGEATQAILSSTIDFQIASTTGLMGNVKGGKLRLLAVSGDKRLAALPEVPNFVEAGTKWPGVVNWTGLWAPKGTPPDAMARLP